MQQASLERSIRLDTGGQGDPLGIVEKLTFDQTNKWYIHNTKFVLENETHKLLWDFEIQTDHLISTRRIDQVIINKKR